MEEEARGAKLHLGVSAFAMLSIEIFTTGMPKCEMRNGEINARPYGFNPMVQVNLNMIGGLLLHFTVNQSVTIQLAKLIHDS
jgi:hypothetical protein